MKAQELRDRLAAVRSFDIYIDGLKVVDVVIDITNNRAHILSTPASSVDLTDLDNKVNGNTQKKEDKKKETDKLFEGLLPDKKEKE